jgi:hypothetical protein
MARVNLRRRATRRREQSVSPKPPPPWPVDPQLARRVTEARARLERTRRELRRQVPLERQERTRSRSADVD